ncbi:MAG: Rrf2 family transcriptional regulator [Acidobacteriia bacterium]|nr:Rrf2 family transcriptional regulator [Terriglobia bacterium]
MRFLDLLLQHASELALRATLFLAQQAPGKLSPVHEVAAHTGISEAYLAKIFQRLGSSGLVRSFRGPGRGMELGRAPASISLAAVVRAVEGSKEWGVCVLGLGVCSEENPCPLHEEWLPLRAAIHNFLEKTTLADLVRVVDKKSLRQKPRVLDLIAAEAAAVRARERKRL